MRIESLERFIKPERFGKRGFLRGKAISARDLKGLLKSSYQVEPSRKVAEWELDEDISKPTARVYYNRNIDQAIVIHRGTEGTLSDWNNNLQYVLGTNKLTHRFKEAERVQKRAEAKYPNLLTVGHSQGGIYTKIAKDQSKVINVNPASMGEVSNTGTTIRSASDPVSALAGFTNIFRSNPKNITTSFKANPLAAHSPDILDELGDRMLGGRYGTKAKVGVASKRQGGRVYGLTDLFTNPSEVFDVAFTPHRNALNEAGQEVSTFVKRRRGKSVMDYIRDPKKAIRDARYAVIGTSPYKTVEGVIRGSQDYAPYVRKLLAEHGNHKILSLTAYRKPVDKPLIAALNVVSLGQFAKQNPYDELFHLSLVAQMDGHFISIEKIENINLVLNPKTHPKAESQVIGNFQPLTLNELMEGGKRILGDKFFKYDASNNNCQDFIMALLKGSDLGTSENYKFIKQNTEQIFKGLDKTLALSNTLTDLGNRGSVALYGGKVKKESPWISHVKSYAQKHNVSYKQAMMDSKATYRS